MGMFSWHLLYFIAIIMYLTLHVDFCSPWYNPPPGLTRTLYIDWFDVSSSPNKITPRTHIAKVDGWFSYNCKLKVSGVMVRGVHAWYMYLSHCCLQQWPQMISTCNTGIITYLPWQYESRGNSIKKNDILSGFMSGQIISSQHLH